MTLSIPFSQAARLVEHLRIALAERATVGDPSAAESSLDDFYIFDGVADASGAIVDVVQSGFMIGERLLRPALVTVAKKDMPAQPVSVDTKA